MLRLIVVCVMATLFVVPRADAQFAAGDSRKNQTTSKHAKSGYAASEAAEGESAAWQTVSSGGGTSQSDSTATAFLIGQPVIGESTNQVYTLYQGFGGAFIVSLNPDCLTGDVDGTGSINIDDVVYLIEYNFRGGLDPHGHDCCSDINGNGDIDLDDVVYLIAYVFQSGPPPIDAC